MSIAAGASSAYRNMTKDIAKLLGEKPRFTRYPRRDVKKLIKRLVEQKEFETECAYRRGRAIGVWSGKQNQVQRIPKLK